MDESTDSKKPAENKNPTSAKGGKGGGRPQKTTKVATSIKSVPLPAQSEITGSGQIEQPLQQVDTPQGTNLNEKGSLAGEAGNRKIQKPQLSIGKVQVSEMSSSKMNNMLCIAFEDLELAKLFSDLLDGTWRTVDYNCFNMKINDKLIYWVLVNLTFNVKYSTLETKFGKCMRNSKYCFNKKIKPQEWSENFDTIEQNFNTLINNQIKAEVSISTFDSCLEDEIKQSQYYSKSQGTSEQNSKKRKFV